MLARYARSQRELVAIFERFTEGARRVVVYAQEESRTLGHGHIGTEHLLLGVLHGGDATADVFAGAGVSLDAARAELGPPAGARPKSGHIPFTADAKHVLEMSLREAMALDHDFISCAHIALALLDERAGQAARIARALGADVDELRDGIAAVVVDEGTTPPGGPGRQVRFLSSAALESAASGGSGPAELRSQRDLLADALRRYGRHEPGCPGESGSCSCGLAAVLALAETWPEPA